MKKVISLNGKEICYELEYKKVKNINLRIRPDGSVYVSANRWVGEKVIKDFIVEKSDFIIKAIEQTVERKEKATVKYFNENELCVAINDLCEKWYPYFEKYSVVYPKIKFRKMVSRWGSCNVVKKIITFNLNLVYAPIECVEYVVLHEFTHFLQANHSSAFYAELSKVCPEWEKYREKLKSISIR